MATNTPWDGTAWDTAGPDIDQPHGNAYKEIFDLRKGIAIRMNKEHETLATSSAGGVHKQGSARAFFQDAAPTTQVDGTAWDSGDTGSLWFDSNSSPDNQMNVLTDSASTGTWTPVSTEIIATLIAAARQWADVQTFDVQTVHTLGILSNGSITLGPNSDLIGDATGGTESDINMGSGNFTVAGATGNTVIAGTLGVTGVLTTTAAAVLGDGSTLAAATESGDGDRAIADKAYVHATAHEGGVVACVSTQTGATATGATTMPADDTIPQITEGNEFMTRAITPSSATSNLKIEVVVNVATSNASSNLTLALFQDATAGALAAVTFFAVDLKVHQLVLTHFMAAGTTSSTTFRARAGCDAAATVRLNGQGAARMLGGVFISSITVTEYKG